MKIVNTNRCAYRTDLDEILEPLGCADATGAWFARFGAINRLLSLDDFEKRVRDKMTHKQLANMVRIKLPAGEAVRSLVNASTDEALRELLLAFNLRGEEGVAFLEDALVIEAAPSGDDLKREALRDALDADDYNRVLSMVNDIIGGGVPRKKAEVYALAERILAPVVVESVEVKLVEAPGA